jgi:hypothetical protein
VWKLVDSPSWFKKTWVSSATCNSFVTLGVVIADPERGSCTDHKRSLCDLRITKSNGRYFQGMAQSAIDKSHQVQSWTR